MPIRCIRIHTNIDLTKVRINSLLYKSNELENKIFVPERNKVIVDTYLEFVKFKKTVVFCASVRHANEMRREQGLIVEKNRSPYLRELSNND